MKIIHNFRFITNSVSLLCISLLVLSSSLFTLHSQNVAINATGNQADPSAMLDVSSQTAGVLIPRMSTVARNAISSPAVGLQVFNTDCNELNYWTGTCWISTGSLPAPGPITTNSATALCASVTATYSITAITGATTYVWMVPAGATINSGQGTTSISVTWGNFSGEVAVRAKNVCESSDMALLDINVSPIPPTPGNITGLAIVNPGQNLVTYFIASVSGAGVYNWSVPSGATITAGVGTPAITVSYSCTAVSGNVSVTAGSNCGTSSPASLFVTVTPLSVNAGSPVFGGVAIGGSPTASGGQTPYTYLWSPTTNLSGSAIANPTAQCSGTTTIYTVTVTDANGCNATGNVTVTRNLTANAGANHIICFGNSAAIGGSPTASGGNSSSYTYSWSPNTNLTSSTVANPTANPASTTTYMVTITDANGCTATNSMTLTVNALPLSTFTNSTPTDVSTAVTYTPTTTSGVTYSWTFTGGSPGTSTVQNPSVIWSSTGTYNVSLTVTSTSTGCSSSITTNAITIFNPTVVTFTNTGTTTWTAPAGLTNVQVLVVAGGGGGGGTVGGGGGGGGVIYNAAYSVSPGNYTVTVGAGGLGGVGYNNSGQTGLQGSNSVFGTLTAIGGGGGAGWSGYLPTSGGSGGGGSGDNSGSGAANGASGISGQGYAGGNGGDNNHGAGGGGGGGAGVNYPPNGNGGIGFLSAISGSPVYYAGGGGGGTRNGNGSGETGGLGGGGNGLNTDSKASDGTPNTGGGGGGAGYINGSTSRVGGDGGSGIVIIAY